MVQGSIETETWEKDVVYPLVGNSRSLGGYEAEYDNISIKTGALNISPQVVNEIIEKLIDLEKITRHKVADH